MAIIAIHEGVNNCKRWANIQCTDSKLDDLATARCRANLKGEIDQTPRSASSAYAYQPLKQWPHLLEIQFKMGALKGTGKDEPKKDTNLENCM